ncbi:hypothetical protein BCR42DRAFT_401410 [Absidia repens]|uniref:Uncharacterized protein n=1 Tax=Absidia repens TaxID=90262 RepID=A0A1X2J2I1_9FUNG|nr:hypothetical protein BCR42DRAFT_401410 [Absidia repens]
MPPQRVGSLLHQLNYQDAASILHQLVDEQNSPVQLAAISNYKLAQLTFAPPDIHSLRKTAVIKNTAQYIYDITPKEWLNEMTRWEFFTLESLDDVDMTQEGLETILSEYVQIMDSFKAGNSNETKDDPTNSVEQDSVNDKVQTLPSSHHQTEETIPPERSSSVGSTTSTTTTNSYVTTASSVSSAALPTPPARHEMTEQRRKSFRLNQQRISWTSDTGLTSFAASQHLAGELMSLFDMEFKVDISLDPYSAPAPQLPELSYFTEKQQHRSSVDSFMCLIPAFESFQIDSQDGLSFVSKANKRTSILAGGGTANRRISSSLAPTRSSSLKYKNGTQQSSSRGNSNSNSNSNGNNDATKLVETSSKNRSPQQYPISSSETQDRRPLTKKKSIRKLVSLFGKKRLNSETALPLDHQSPLPVKSSAASMSTPSLSHSTLANSTSPYNAITPSSLVSTSTSPSSIKTPLPMHHVITSPEATNPVSTHKDITPPTSATVSPSDTYTSLITSPTHQQPAPPTTTTRAQRRRSNSVPGISTTFINQINEEQKQREYRQSHHTQSLPFEEINHTNTTQQFSQPNIYPPSPVTPITGGNDEETGKHPLPQSISSYELSSYGRLERNQSLSRSSAALGQRQQYQLQQQQQQYQHHQYHHQHQDMRQYHSTHDLSRIYTNEHTNNNNSGGSDESKESMTLTSPTSPKKPSSSSFLQRMTTFARRKKPANALKQSSSHSLVPA